LLERVKLGLPPRGAAVNADNRNSTQMSGAGGLT
jgi:hypothetical protein